MTLQLFKFHHSVIKLFLKEIFKNFKTYDRSAARIVRRFCKVPHENIFAEFLNDHIQEIHVHVNIRLSKYFAYFQIYNIHYSKDR